MANTGIIGGLFPPPPKNDGSKHGAGTITEDGTNKEFVFQTPQDVNQTSVPLAEGAKVNFDNPVGNQATNVASDNPV